MKNSSLQLSKMKKLIREKKRSFKVRRDRNYLQDLADIGITVEEAWNTILGLNINFLIPDARPSYNSDPNTLIFIRDINGIKTYIKLTIIETESEEEVVCFSFHISGGGKE